MKLRGVGGYPGQYHTRVRPLIYTSGGAGKRGRSGVGPVLKQALNITTVKPESAIDSLHSSYNFTYLFYSSLSLTHSLFLAFPLSIPFSHIHNMLYTCIIRL